MPSILQKLFGRWGAASAGDRAAPAVNLAAFGKHPAWNDFADDFGLETQRLIDVKRLLFQGIDANIAGWERLEEHQRLDGFHHMFVWQMGDATVAGRLWASSDGKGRSRYPMVACAEFTGLPLPAVLNAALPALQAVEQACVAAKTHEAVVAALEAARRDLRRLAAPPIAAPNVAAASVTTPTAGGTGTVADVSPGEAAARLLGCAELGGRGLVSMLYRLEQEAPGQLTWGRDPWNSSSDPKSVTGRPAHVRLPACAPASATAALLWLRFLANVVNARASQLLILPVGERWVDLIVGDPTGPSLYCLMTNEKGTPLTTDIPYTIDGTFAEKAGQFLASYARDGAAAR